MRVFFAAAEMTPFAKVGGLADVTGSLPKALKKIGVDVTVLFPKYATIDEKRFGLAPMGEAVRVRLDGKEENLPLWKGALPESDVPVVFFEHPARISNGGIYGEAGVFPEGINGELERFGLFSAAVAEYVAQQQEPPLLHCHDWHVALSIPILKKLHQSPVKTLLTIHNLAYQGVFPRHMVAQSLGEQIAAAIPQEAFVGNNKELANFFASGILATDWASTVSPTYRDEILTPEGGAGLDWTLREKQNRFMGILNGIDTETWNPKTDHFIAAQYTKTSIAKKTENKKAPQTALGLPENTESLLCGMVSRLTEQKGFDILLPALADILAQNKNIQFAFLATGDPRYAQTLKKLAQQSPQHVVFVDRFDEKIAHQIYAGSDAFLMPSRFEPCGLGQMIAMRYGTLPIARATGGLKDTITDIAKPDGTGFVFDAYTQEALTQTIMRAVSMFASQKEHWRVTVLRAMQKDFSWTESARHYKDLYESITKT